MNEKRFELVAYLRKITGFKSLSILPFLLKGQIGIRRFSTNENFTLSEFCETYKIEFEQKELSLDGFAATDTYNSLKINEFKTIILTKTDSLHKHQTGWKLSRYQECILNFAAQCSISPEYAEKKISPLLSYQYKDAKTSLFKPSYQLGCRHYIINSDGSTDKRWSYTVQNYLYSGYYLQPEKELEALQNAKYIVLCEGEKDVISANYHLGKYNVVAVTCGGVANWCTASAQLQFLRNTAPNALIISLFDHDEAGRTAAQTLQDQKIPKLLWTDLFKGDLKKGFDVCDAFQQFPNAKEVILAHLEHHSIHRKTEKQISGAIGTYLSTVLAEHNIPVDIASFKNTIVISQTGSGKGYIMEQMCQKGFNICIFPVESLVEQMTDRIRKAGCKVFSYFGEHPILNDLGDHHTITTTIASFPKLVRKLIEKYGESFLKNINILWDEEHHFTASANPGFMLMELSRSIELLPLFGSFTGFTGTYIPNSHPFLAGLSILKVDIPIIPPQIDILICNDTILSTATKIREHVQKGEKFAVLLNNKGAKLDKLRSSIKDLKVAVLNSDTKESDDFKSIINNEKLADDVVGLISTSVLREGTNIFNEINHIYVDSKKFSLYEIWQFINRFRTSIKAGTLKVHIMCSKFEEPDYTVPAFDFASELANFRKDCQNITNAINHCQSATMKEQQLDGHQLFANYPIFYNRVDNLLEINELHLSNMVHNQETRHTYSSAATFKAMASQIGFEFTGITEYDHTIEKETIAEIVLDVKLAKELRQCEYEKILDDLKKIQAEEKNEDLSKVTVFEHIEQMKKVKNLTPVEKIVYEGLQSLCPFYDKSENLIQDVETMVKKPKKSQFSLLKRRLRARNFIKSEAMESKCEVASVIQSLIANIIFGEIYVSEELKEIVLAAMSGHQSFKHLVKKIKAAKRIDTVLKILEAFFSIKIGKSNCEMRYKLNPIAFYSDWDKKPKDLMEPVFDLF
jgi:hypothetical protein